LLQILKWLFWISCNHWGSEVRYGSKARVSNF
jgi:hypothetical protein